MSQFSEFKDFHCHDPENHIYILDEELCWDIGRKGSMWQMRVPQNTCFDISVPFVLRWYLSPDDPRVLPCAALHDELLLQDFDRPFASAEFRRAVIARGCSSFRGWILFLATLIWTVATQRTSEKVREKRMRQSSGEPG